jgi:hypothetical protein
VPALCIQLYAQMSQNPLLSEAPVLHPLEYHSIYVKGDLLPRCNALFSLLATDFPSGICSESISLQIPPFFVQFFSDIRLIP